MPSSSSSSSSSAELNEDVLESILRKSRGCCGGLRSHLRFGRVCSSWRSVAKSNPYNLVPWLMLSKSDSNQETRSFLSLDEKQIHEIKLPEDANSSWCCGSSEGWLVMSHRESGNFLYNPITCDRIDLPRHKNAPKVVIRNLDILYPDWSFYLSKAIVVTSSSIYHSSSSSSTWNKQVQPTQTNIKLSNDVVLVAVIFAQTRLIGFCQPGDKKWQVFDTYPPNSYICEGSPMFKDAPPGHHYFEEEEEEDDDAALENELRYPNLADIILFRGALYVVTHGAVKLGVIQFKTSTTPANDDKVLEVKPIQWLNVLPLKRKTRYCHWNYLVESCGGELLMVVRIRRDGPGQGFECKNLETLKFYVYKLDESSDPMKWVKVESLGDQILFLGSNHSKSISASDIPGSRGNCIYFTRDFSWQYLWLELQPTWSNPSSPFTCRDVGVYYLEDGTIETSFLMNDEGMRFPTSLEYPPIFITPNPSSFTLGGGGGGGDAVKNNVVVGGGGVDAADNNVVVDAGKNNAVSGGATGDKFISSSDRRWRYAIKIIGIIAINGLLFMKSRSLAQTQERNYILYGPI